MRTPPRPAPARISHKVQALLIVMTTLAGTVAHADESRAAVPDAGARSAAVSELRKELHDKLDSKDAAIRRALAKTLMERAQASAGEPVKRFVLLDQVVTLAEGLRDVALAMDALEQLATVFQMERAPRGLAAMDTITRGAKEMGVLAEAAGACVDLAGAALIADDPNSASRGIATAKTLAKSAKLSGLVARATELGTFVDAFRRASAAAAVARKTLLATPDDPAAHEALGRFLAFGRGRFDEGLADLAKSAQAGLAGAATTESTHSEDAAARQALADVWWELAQKEKDPLARARMLARAATTYEKAPADAPAERAALVKGRLDSLTYWAFERSVALTKDFSKDGPVSLALATVRSFINQQKVDHTGGDWRLSLPHFPDIAFGRGEEYLWRLDTSEGAITLRLFSDTAPKHVANILYLTELGFFDGLLFHRVVSGFMAQGGCPKRDGSGNPGYLFEREPNTTHKHDKAGVLSMANTGIAKSEGSQFFITFRATPDLDDKHTVFGEVVDGMDVLKKLDAQGTPDPGKPKIPITIKTARASVR